MDTSIESPIKMSTRIRFAARAHTANRTETMAQTRRKGMQRERLLQGMVTAANKGGYAGASISAVIAAAGVSRPTFYEYFSDRDDCFQACIRDVQDQLSAIVEDALSGQAADAAAAAAIQALVDYASAEPARARFLMAESMSGGARALDARDSGIAGIAASVERTLGDAPGDASIADLDARILVATVYRTIATRLRRGEMAVATLAEELLGWVAAYVRPARELRWQKLAALAPPGRSPHVPDVPVHQMQEVLPPGRPRISEQEVAENHRLRILYATARMAKEKGYSATTVADITRLASVDGSAFYRLFSDKQDAFVAVHELGFQQVMDVTAKAFFSANSWPERSWEAGRALTQLLQDNPLVAHVGFVEAYAVGPRAVQRIEDSHTAFMFFLQEGLLQRPQTSAPSRVAMEAIVAAIFEIIYLQARRLNPQIAGMLAHIAHIWLAPFLGADAADAFIDGQLQASGVTPPSPQPRAPVRRAARGRRGSPQRQQ
jgi:AcrR family transcriptional regulator